uniref:Protein kinase domain-containing protein n=1 Tax=Amphimedon queenslandica TaxID=400682 RepID=A0A1X7TF44_AMPQE
MFQSTSELVEQNIYKVLYDLEEINLFFLTSNAHHSPTRFIHRQLVKKYPYVIYSYKKVPYGPLSIVEASECLKYLLLSIKEALKELHSCGLRHNDLRLPNVCFNSEYEAILIDLDACTPAEYRHSSFSGANSCMYKAQHLPHDGSTDYMQLGWLIVNVLDPTGDEHNRKYEEI